MRSTWPPGSSWRSLQRSTALLAGDEGLAETGRELHVKDAREKPGEIVENDTKRFGLSLNETVKI